MTSGLLEGCDFYWGFGGLTSSGALGVYDFCWDFGGL